MASTIPFPQMTSNRTWLHRWIYTLAAGFMFSASTLRAYVTFQDSDLLGQVLLLLALWLLLFVCNALLRDYLSWSTAIFLVAEAAVLLYLLLITEEDFFAFLFGLIGMQAMQCYSPRVVASLVLLFAILVFLILLERTGWLQALALTMIYSTLGAFMAAYIWSIRRAEVIKEQQYALLSQLQGANQQLEFHAHQQEQLITGRERQRLARELHDSVTQSLYSVTMYAEAAARLMPAGHEAAAEHLRDARDTAQEALREMRLLIYQLRPPVLEKGGLAVALQVRLDAVERRGGIHAELTVEGEDRLPPAVQTELHQIAQEALNNALKHAHARQVQVILHFGDAVTQLQIQDDGVGFDLAAAQAGGGLGLPGMAERAQKIGGRLDIESAPGRGTRVVVEVSTGGGG